MSAPPLQRPSAREAGPELLVLQRWEDFAAWFLRHTSRWPRSLRFPLVQRLHEGVLEVADALVVARYQREEREALLRGANLRLERMRLLLRLARSQGVVPARSFERAQRGLDETGRMIHGWRRALSERGSRDA